MSFADAYRWWQRIGDKTRSVGISRSFASWGRNSLIQFPLRLSGEERIAIGSGVFIGAGSWLQVIDPASASAPAIVVGDGTRVSGGCVLSAVASIEIGDNVLIARNVYIADHSHAYLDPDLPIRLQGLTNIAPVTIGDGAWLGQNVVVNPGVRIGRNAVVGANSVVTTSIPDYSLAVGAPARVVRTWASPPGRPD
ncbi:MAG: hypothetical protein QOJ62_2102 [Actinomycetota bacterium]|nr:hypothetical protein [Actinomycetota bacterium]